MCCLIWAVLSPEKVEFLLRWRRWPDLCALFMNPSTPVSLFIEPVFLYCVSHQQVFFFFVLFTFFFPFCVPTVAQVQELQYHMKRASPTLSAFREHLQSLGRFLHSKKAFQSCHSPTSVSRTVHFITVMD